MSKLLIAEPPLQVLPSLAVKVGLNEAIVLQQLHYWLESPTIGQKDESGLKWVSNTYDEWHRNFPFWSTRTLERLFTSLEKDGWIISRQVGKKNWDRRKSYRIAYDVIQSRHTDVTEDDNLSASQTTTCRDHIQRLQTETTAEREKPLYPLEGKELLGCVVPEVLEPHKEAIEEWLAYKREKGQKYKPLGLARLLRRLAAMPNPTDAIADSMACNYSGVFDHSSKPAKETFEDKARRLGLA